MLRLVTKLSYVVDEHGMNLSYPVLASFIKYPCPSSRINKSKLSTKKMGYFVAEEEIFTSICGTLGLHHCRHPLAFLLEAADDIAYLSADIEDAQHKGIVSVDCLVSYLESAKDDKIVQYVRSEICRYKKDANKVNYPDVDGYIIHRVRILVKGLMIDAMYDAFKELYPNIMEGNCEEELISRSKVSKLADVLKTIEREKITIAKTSLKAKHEHLQLLVNYLMFMFLLC